MKRDKARFAIYAMGGLYLLYLAWKMYGDLSTAGTEKTLMIVFIVLFALIGVVMAGWAFYTGWKLTQNMGMGTEPEEESAEREEFEKQEVQSEESEEPKEK